MTATIICFEPAKEKSLLLAYQQAKYQVFYQEYGWHALAVDQAQGIALLDDYDGFSRFFAAVIDDKVVGFLRGTDTAIAFPHASLFQRQQSLLNGCRSVSLNALCVRKPYRGQQYAIGPKPQKLGSALLHYASNYYRAEQFDWLLSSTNPDLVNKVFLPAGFIVLEQGISLSGSPTQISNLCLPLSVKAKQAIATRG
ncbi:GNAT family N-acetyltransferase [Neiella sp. HB171785]|uniref:GNAT family N-acetyltransferase n=1 Tax=Neiella litorisoli TaxID=2771431 RepID=A0A8J6QPN8_9GAMM|nr:GNAT family N-acetyltransferase [Neiella litorisoli]MBD1388776.1 GNAT family N-acetyltransferase [Neiella litorisoli]